MRTPVLQIFGFLYLPLLAPQAFAQTVSNPVGLPSGRISALEDSQFLAARFALSIPSALGSVGGEFVNTSGSFFVALVPLSSMTALPVGNTAAGIPFNPGEVLAYETFSADVSTSRIVTVPFSIQLTPGVYGVIFGTGLFGTHGSGGMPDYQTVVGSSSFSWSSEPWRWQDSRVVPNEEWNILLTIGPQLTITPRGSNVVLSWPTNAVGFNLQSAASTASGALWTNVLPGPVERNGSFIVTNPISGSRQFYRLSQ